MEPTMIEKEQPRPTVVTEVLPMGYGNAESSISRTKQLESGELPVEVDASAQEFIVSKEGFRAVDDIDDGCIDGRETVELYTVNGETQPADSSNHERAKVAGGGYITGQAIRLGVGARGASIDADLLNLGTDLAEQGVYCGAHSGAHKHGEGTDCGANDKLPLILHNAIAYREQISGTTKALIEQAGLEYKQEVLDQVLANWEDTLSDETYFEGSTGASRLSAILSTQAVLGESEGRKPVAVTKHLAGDHNEDYIIINYVAGTTFSQNAMHSALKEKFSELPDENLAQAFVVDAWRVVELANAAVETEDTEAAIYAGVAYQLATAATLTDGSLKIFVHDAE